MARSGVREETAPCGPGAFAVLGSPGTVGLGAGQTAGGSAGEWAVLTVSLSPVRILGLSRKGLNTLAYNVSSERAAWTRGPA